MCVYGNNHPNKRCIGSRDFKRGTLKLDANSGATERPQSDHQHQNAIMTVKKKRLFESSLVLIEK